MNVIEKLRAMEAAATPAPWPEIPIKKPKEMPAGYYQMPWTTMSLADYALAVKVRNLLPALLALWEAADRFANRPAAPANMFAFTDALEALNASAKENLE